MNKMIMIRCDDALFNELNKYSVVVGEPKSVCIRSILRRFVSSRPINAVEDALYENTMQEASVMQG